MPDRILVVDDEEAIREIVCAILMPLSSATVVTFACGATAWLGRGLGKSALRGKTIAANKMAELVQRTAQAI